MTSNPIIIDATGFWIPSDNKGRTLILWKTDTGGWHRIQSGDNLTGNIYGTEDLCTGSISEYVIKVFEYTSNYANGFATSYRCNTDANENCILNTCSGTPVLISSLQFPITTYSPNIPNPINNITVTPGDRQLIFNWTPVSNIFAYYYELRDPWNTVIRGGYLSKNDVTHSFINLTNDLTYTLSIKTVSYSYIIGNPISLQGTPKACPLFIAGIDVEDFFLEN